MGRGQPGEEGGEGKSPDFQADCDKSLREDRSEGSGHRGRERGDRKKGRRVDKRQVRDGDAGELRGREGRRGREGLG